MLLNGDLDPTELYVSAASIDIVFIFLAGKQGDYTDARIMPLVQILSGTSMAMTKSSDLDWLSTDVLMDFLERSYG